MRFCIAILILGCLSQVGLAQSVHVTGLFKGMVMLNIDGQQRLIKNGEVSPEGVKVIEATSRYAVVEIDGVEQRLTLTQKISSHYTVKERPEVTIRRTDNNQYLTQAHINDRRVKVLVDTGATSVAMSESHAKQLNLKYTNKGITGSVSTASGVSSAYHIILRSLTVGGITVNGVPALVIEGTYPRHILLGMSYLKHVEMTEKDGIMTLKSKF